MENNILERFNSFLDEIWDASNLLEAICISIENIQKADNTCSCTIKELGKYARELAAKDWVSLIEKQSYLNTLRMCCTEEISLDDALNYFKVEIEKLDEVKNVFSSK